MVTVATVSRDDLRRWHWLWYGRAMPGEMTRTIAKDFLASQGLDPKRYVLELERMEDRLVWAIQPKNLTDPHRPRTS